MNTKELAAKLDEIATSIGPLAKEREARVGVIHAAMLALHAVAPLSEASRQAGPGTPPPTREDADRRLLWVEAGGTLAKAEPAWRWEARAAATTAFESWLDEQGIR